MGTIYIYVRSFSLLSKSSEKNKTAKGNLYCSSISGNSVSEFFFFFFFILCFLLFVKRLSFVSFFGFYFHCSLFSFSSVLWFFIPSLNEYGPEVIFFSCSAQHKIVPAHKC